MSSLLDSDVPLGTSFRRVHLFLKTVEVTRHLGGLFVSRLDSAADDLEAYVVLPVLGRSPHVLK